MVAGQCYEFPKLFYYPLRHREKLHSLDLLTSRWDCETEFWLMVLGKNKVHHFQDCPLNIPHNLPPPFSPTPVVKKVTDLYNVRSLDKCAPCLEENHSETPPDQKYMHWTLQELERNLHCIKPLQFVCLFITTAESSLLGWLQMLNKTPSTKKKKKIDGNLQ